MNIAFFGRIRIGAKEPTRLPVAELWIDDRHSIWERQLDCLSDLLVQPEEKR